MPPDRHEARAMLHAAKEAEEQTRNPPLPWRFFIAQAVLVTVICWAQILPINPARVVTAVGFIAIAGVGMRWVFTRPGYGIVWPDGPAAFPFMMALLVSVGVPAVLAIGFGASLLWFIAGISGGATTLEMGRRYRRATARV